MWKWLWVGDSHEHGSLQAQTEETGASPCLLQAGNHVSAFNVPGASVMSSDFCVRVCTVSDLHCVSGTSSPIIRQRGDAALLPLHPPVQHARGTPVP